MFGKTLCWFGLHNWFQTYADPNYRADDYICERCRTRLIYRRWRLDKIYVEPAEFVVMLKDGSYERYKRQ